MDKPVLADQQRLTYISYVQTPDAVKRTWQEQWMIATEEERERERESSDAVLSVRLEDYFT